MKYTILAMSSHHAGDIENTATSKKQAIEIHDKMCKTVLHDLAIPTNGKATVLISTSKGCILKSNVSHGKTRNTPVIESRENPFGKSTAGAIR